MAIKSFPVMYTGETRSLVFKFAPDLESTETITSAAAVAVVQYGTDAAPSAIFNGAVTVNGGTDVIVPVRPLVTNVDYKITITANTSLARVLKFAARLAVRTA